MVRTNRYLNFLCARPNDDIAHYDRLAYIAATCRVYRSRFRSFLRYLHQERKIIKRDLAALVTSRRSYSRAKPPKFLRPQEIQKLFAGLEVNTPADIRSQAMVHLAYLYPQSSAGYSTPPADIFYPLCFLPGRNRSVAEGNFQTDTQHERTFFNGCSLVSDRPFVGPLRNEDHGTFTLTVDTIQGGRRNHLH